MSIELTSPAFEQGQPIPKQFTGDGLNVTPPLKWKNPLDGAKTFALICEDPEAPRGTWTHWVIFDLPPETRELAQGIPAEAMLRNGTTQGKNDFGKIGYGGPAPPPGKPHRYFFKLFDVDQKLNLPAGVTRAQLLEALKGHVLAEAELMGTYKR